MPQLQNLVLTDRATPTPVDHTFTPRDIVQGVGSVIESSGTPIGDNRFTVSLKETPQGRFKGVLKGTFPIVQNQVVNGITTPVVVRTAYVTAEFSFDRGSTEQERKDAVGMLVSSLDPSKTLVNDAIVKLQGVY